MSLVCFVKFCWYAVVDLFRYLPIRECMRFSMPDLCLLTPSDIEVYDTNHSGCNLKERRKSCYNFFITNKTNKLNKIKPLCFTVKPELRLFLLRQVCFFQTLPSPLLMDVCNTLIGNYFFLLC